MELHGSVGQLQAILAVPHSRLRLYQAVLGKAPSAEALAVALRATAGTIRLLRSQQHQVSLAWTYSGRAQVGLRTTGRAAREIIEASERTLLVLGYSLTVDTNLAGLAASTIEAIARAAERGVVVTAVLHREANREALLQAWKPGVIRPAIFTWPLAEDDPKASMHAKVLVSDRSEALVTSANLTYHGFERNFEIGLRVKGRVASELDDGIHQLIRSGEFIPWGG